MQHFYKHLVYGQTKDIKLLTPFLMSPYSSAADKSSPILCLHLGLHIICAPFLKKKQLPLSVQKLNIYTIFHFLIRKLCNFSDCQPQQQRYQGHSWIGSSSTCKEAVIYKGSRKFYIDSSFQRTVFPTFALIVRVLVMEGSGGKNSVCGICWGFSSFSFQFIPYLRCAYPV